MVFFFVYNEYITIELYIEQLHVYKDMCLKRWFIAGFKKFYSSNITNKLLFYLNILIRLISGMPLFYFLL